MLIRTVASSLNGFDAWIYITFSKWICSLMWCSRTVVAIAVWLTIMHWLRFIALALIKLRKIRIRLLSLQWNIQQIDRSRWLHLIISRGGKSYLHQNGSQLWIQFELEFFYNQQWQQQQQHHFKTYPMHIQFIRIYL